MKTLILIDRDGTIVYDDMHFFIGKTPNWKEKIIFLPKVLDGLKKMKEIPEVKFYIITNQAGVSIKDFPFYTEMVAKEATEEIVNRIKKAGGQIDGYFMCTCVPETYKDTHGDYSYVDNHAETCVCFKPGVGMVVAAMKREELTEDNANIIVIGDRMTDVQTGIAAKGYGILIPFVDQDAEKARVQEKFPGNPKVHIAPDMMDAADWIITQINK